MATNNFINQELFIHHTAKTYIKMSVILVHLLQLYLLFFLPFLFTPSPFSVRLE